MEISKRARNFFSDLDDSAHNAPSWSFGNTAVEDSGASTEPAPTKKQKVSESASVSRPSGNVSTESFSKLNLARPLLRACSTLGFSGPTKVQERTVPVVLQGNDVLISAMTGSGKTAAFALPILQRLLLRNKRLSVTRALIILPTRELAQQCLSMVELLSGNTDIKSGVVIGGASIVREQAILNSYPDILIATPGKLIDHMRNSKGFTLDHISFLILDEADKLLDMGFRPEIVQIMKEIGPDRQTILASATLTDSIKELSDLALKKPVKISVYKATAVPEGLNQLIVRVHNEQLREAQVLTLIKMHAKSSVILFFTTKKSAHRFAIIMKLQGLSYGEVHGDLSQTQRLDSLNKFQNGWIDFLVCTDVAARGLDLPADYVINAEFPVEDKRFIHRVGRTARAGRSGISITLCNDSERTRLRKQFKGLKALAIKQDELDSAQSAIESMKSQIKEVWEEEIAEMILRKTELEARKAENMMNHSDEIYNRPKRTWFQTERQKRDLKAKTNPDYVPEETVPSRFRPKMSKDVEKSVGQSRISVQHDKIAMKGIKMADKERRMEKAKKRREKHKPKRHRKQKQAR